MLPVSALSVLPLPQAAQMDVPGRQAVVKIRHSVQTSAIALVSGAASLYEGRTYLMDPLHMQGDTRGSLASPVSQQILQTSTVAGEDRLSASDLTSGAECPAHLGLKNCSGMPRSFLSYGSDMC